MDYKLIKSTAKDRVATITINRPEKRNALNGEVVKELRHAFDSVRDDSSVKIVILAGEGKVFCAGADLAFLQELQSNSYEENLDDSESLKSLLFEIYTFPKIVIARVHGHAIAGGCGLATVCDFIFSVPEAKFGYTEVRIGFVPALVMVFLLRKIGESRSRNLLLTGELITAQMAFDYGLLFKISNASNLDKDINEFVQLILDKNSAEAMARTKEMIAEIPSLSLEDALAYAARQNALARETEDCKKGIDSFLSKTDLHW